MMSTANHAVALKYAEQFILLPELPEDYDIGILARAYIERDGQYAAQAKRIAELERELARTVYRWQQERQRSERLQAVVDAAKAFVPFWLEGWDEYDEPNDQEAARKAGDAIVAAVRALDKP